jgi:hypothetical protein
MLAAPAPTAARPTRLAGARRIARRPATPARAGLDTNLFVNILASSVCGVVPAAVGVLTAQKSDDEFKKLTTLEGAAPYAAAVVADAVAHSIPGEKRGLEGVASGRGGVGGRIHARRRPPGAAAAPVAPPRQSATCLSSKGGAGGRGKPRLAARTEPPLSASPDLRRHANHNPPTPNFPSGLNVLFSLAAEPAGAAAGVAYLMSLILSSPAVDPTTLAPKGSVLNADVADDARAAVRAPLADIVPTALAVVDFTNSGSSGAGWSPAAGGSPKLPLNSVLIVLGVGGLILEAASHAPLLGLFMPRVLQVTGWLAASGYVLNVTGVLPSKK